MIETRVPNIIEPTSTDIEDRGEELIIYDFQFRLEVLCLKEIHGRKTVSLNSPFLLLFGWCWTHKRGKKKKVHLLRIESKLNFED